MWFLVALILGAAIVGLLLWMRSRSMSLTWYELVIGVIGLLMVLFGVQNYFGSTAEVELNAAPLYLLVVALPGLVLLVVAGFLASRRVKA